MTASTLLPNIRISGPAAISPISVSNSTDPSAPRMTSALSIPSFCDVSSMTAAIDPGPAIIGMAMGKIDTSSISGCSIISCARSSRRSVRFSNTISSAIRNSMMPPAMRKLSRLMPSALSICSPNRAKTSKMSAATRIARMAMIRRSRGGTLLVRLA